MDFYLAIGENGDAKNIFLLFSFTTREFYPNMTKNPGNVKRVHV